MRRKAFVASVSGLLVGTEPRQQLRASQALLALSVYAVFAVVQHVEVLLGMIDEAASWRLTAYNLCGGLGFYALVRSGLNRRFTGDPALTLPQSVWAIVGIAWSYAITGPARGAVLLIMVLVILFGMFALSPARSRALAAFAFSLLAAAMVWKGWTDPARYDPRVEALHLAFAAIVTAACAVLSIRLGRLRARLEAQRSDLAHALERIQDLATRDELTGLLNRRALFGRLQAALRERGRPRRVAVALIDLDHFKRINDAHGHAGGDRVLRHFAETAQAAVREGDLLARWGGEEFLLMMPGADLAQALAALARLREQLLAAPLDAVAPGLVVRFSAGAAVCDDEAALDRAIDAADRAMYAAKQAGRDRAFGPGGPAAAGGPSAVPSRVEVA